MVIRTVLQCHVIAIHLVLNRSVAREQCLLERKAKHFVFHNPRCACELLRSSYVAWSQSSAVCARHSNLDCNWHPVEPSASTPKSATSAFSGYWVSLNSSGCLWKIWEWSHSALQWTNALSLALPRFHLAKVEPFTSKPHWWSHRPPGFGPAMVLVMKCHSTHMV